MDYQYLQFGPMSQTMLISTCITGCGLDVPVPLGEGADAICDACVKEMEEGDTITESNQE
jgi:hypothetical protein